MTDANIAHEAALANEALPIGTKLSGDQFTITGHLGAGGFGITYRAEDNVLGRTIVIKECFPEDFGVRHGKNVVARSANFAKPMRSIIRMFMREARALAKLRHPNIVGVHRAFEENETAYMALDLIEGRDLFDILEAGSPRLSPARVKDILLQLLDAIEKVHAIGLLHRDISPDNILIEKTGTPVLIDFGAARADSSRHTRAVSSLLVVKDGYSPQEFYVAGSEQAPCSDLYALGATFYHVLSGKAPPNSQTRMMEIAGHKPDPCVPLAGRIQGYDEAFLQAIDQAMQIHPGDRLQSAAKWRRLIEDAEVSDADKPQSKARSKGQEISLELEMSLTKLVAETNDEVRRTSQIPVEPEVVEKPKLEAPKPAWIEEFNRESLSPGDGTGTERTPTYALEDDWMPFEPAPEPVASPKRQKTEINWIDRALEKQERIRSERESALEASKADVDGRARSQSSRPGHDMDDELTGGDVAVAPVGRSRYRPIGIALLAICLYLIIFLDMI
jgi:serine/threonine protein kinase